MPAAQENQTPPGWRRWAPAVFLTIAAFLLPAPAAAQETQADPEFTRQGADTCLRCHDTGHVQSIFWTPHGEPADPDTPFASLQCETCHGPGGDHAARIRQDEVRPPIFNFGSDEPYPVADQNEVCLGCHQQDVAKAWHSGPHDQTGTACADCHTSHERDDPVLSDTRQSQVCLDCHTAQRAEFQRAFSHPVRFGELTCSDCHAPHDSFQPALLTANTLNQTCYQCHEEKRGPYLWEHPPAVEDCSDCHRPHGSNHPGLLTKAAPLLCQDCHSRAGHPSVARTGGGLPGNQPSQFLLGGSCASCHSRVHGSNHPSGANLMR